MRQNILTIKQFLPKILIFSFLLSAFMGCKKASNFYEKLQALPQIDNRESFAYKPAYIIGDTMVIIGSLQTKNSLQISIGGKTATIIGIDSVKQDLGRPLDRVSVLIADGMEGKAREVKVTSGGYSVLGANIDVYTPGGPGSFDKDLKSLLIKSFSNGDQNVFLHCINGKGDVYYYSAINKDLRHIAKDGTETILYDLSAALSTGGPSVTEFLAGGVDPQGKQLYFSAKTSPTDYTFCKIDLAGKQLTILNQSQHTEAPYEGTVGNVRMIISGVYPDSKGNVYLGIGLNKRVVVLPDAIARYSPTDGRISYLFKKLLYQNNFPGMPGTTINLSNNSVIAIRFSPDESLLYIMEESFLDHSAAIDMFDVDARVKLLYFSTVNSSNDPAKQMNVIAPFSGLQINMGTGSFPDDSFGYLPMPGKRLQILLSQILPYPSSADATAKAGFPKWIVFDFTDQRTYAYATGRFEQNGYIFQPTTNLFPRSSVRDELLNYDEAGNLYATAKGKAALIRTQPVN